MSLLVTVNCFPAADGQQAFAVYGLPLEGRRLPPGEEVRRVDGVARIQIPDGVIVAAGKREALPRLHREQLEEPLERQQTGLHQPGVEQGKGRLDPDDAEGAAGEALRLLLGAVRGVVGRDAVDRPVEQPLKQGLPILRRAQRRVHLKAPVLLQRSLVEQQVVRRGLAADVHPAGLGLTDKGDALFRGDVADMVGAAGLLRELEVPGDLSPLALGADAPVAVGGGVGTVMDVAAAQETVVLAVGDDQFPERFGAQHGLAHPRVGLHAVPVVREGDDAGREPLEIRERLPLLPDRDRAVGVDADAGAAGDAGLFDGEMPKTVRHRVEVRHGAHVGVTAARGGAAAGLHRLFIRKARLAKMHMHIAKTGQQDIGGGIEGRENGFAIPGKTRGFGYADSLELIETEHRTRSFPTKKPCRTRQGRIRAWTYPDCSVLPISPGRLKARFVVLIIRNGQAFCQLAKCTEKGLYCAERYGILSLPHKLNRKAYYGKVFFFGKNAFSISLSL